MPEFVHKDTAIFEEVFFKAPTPPSFNKNFASLDIDSATKEVLTSLVNAIEQLQDRPIQIVKAPIDVEAPDLATFSEFLSP